MNCPDPASDQAGDGGVDPTAGARKMVFQLEKVSLFYEDAKGESIHALDEIDIQVLDNEFLVVLGPSGCGKSTLLNLMVGLLRPSEGHVRHLGSPVDDTLDDVGMVYQDPLLLKWRNVLDNVLLPIEILKLDRKSYLPKAYDILATAGLAGFEDKMPQQLSGGMQQRVALCRALITDPSLLLMDEPFAALDALTRDEMARELARLWEQRRKTVVFVTHSIAEAVLLADRIIVMSPRPGRIERNIEIKLPRPRADGGKMGQAFEDHVEDIRQTIFSFKQS